MKRSEEARRWLEQAEYDLKTAKTVFDANIFSYTCFLAEESAQKSLKAYLLFNGERYIWELSIINCLPKMMRSRRWSLQRRFLIS